jgi:hypothetical protein
MEIYASVPKIHASVGRRHPCVASCGLTAPNFGPLDLADFISKCPQYRLPLNASTVGCENISQ